MTARPRTGYGAYAELPGTFEAAGRARELTRCALGDDHPSLADVALVVSELVTNSVTHSRSGRPGGTLIVGIETAARGEVRVQVRDAGSAGAPVRADADQGSEHGRGLAIIAALADDWGTTAGPAGRSTWARLRAGRHAGRDEPEREAG